jgi:hypothetical protein
MDFYTLIVSYLDVFVIAEIRNVLKRQTHNVIITNPLGEVFIQCCLYRETINSASTVMAYQASISFSDSCIMHHYRQQQWSTVATWRQSTSKGRLGSRSSSFGATIPSNFTASASVI